MTHVEQAERDAHGRWRRGSGNPASRPRGRARDGDNGIYRHMRHGHDGQTSGMMMQIHPNSRANLRPPWPKGVSGNAKGRRRGSRNRRSLRAERIGKVVLRRFPELAESLDEVERPNNLKHVFWDTVAQLKADRSLAVDATRIAALHAGAFACALVPLNTRPGYTCSRCGGRLFDADPLALLIGFGQLAFFHHNCLVPGLLEHRAKARMILAEQF